MYSMKEKYRQNTNLKSSTSMFASRKYYDYDHGKSDKPSRNDHHREEKTRQYLRDRERSPGNSRHDARYFGRKKDSFGADNSSHLERSRGEKRSSKVLDSKYSSRDKGHSDSYHHRSRIDYLEHDKTDRRDRASHRTSSHLKDRHYASENTNSVFAGLSRVVRKARESRTGWKATDVDEKDLNSKRWGHSGYNELYHGGSGVHKDRELPTYYGSPLRPTSKPDKLSSSASRRPFDRSRSPLSRATARRGDAGAPMSNRRVEGRKDQGRQDARNLDSSKPSISDKTSKPEGIASDKLKAANGKLKTAQKSKAAGANEGKSSAPVKKLTAEEKEEIATIKALRRERLRWAGRQSHSGSSDSLSSLSDHENGSKLEAKSRYSRKSSSASRSRSRSRFSSSSSSDDEDVLELHPTKKRKSGSKSKSSSSDYESRSSRSISSDISCLASTGTGTGTRKSVLSDSSSSSSSISGISKGSKGSFDRREKEKAVNLQPKAGNKVPEKNYSSSKLTQSGSKNGKAVVEKSRNFHSSDISPVSLASAKSGEKAATAVSGKDKAGEGVQKRAPEKSMGTKDKDGGKSKPKKTSAGLQKKSQSSTGKKSGGRAESDSESESSSESDVEPRMSLSERFAKLTQMHTDKREFAKPVLAVNEIDTKMKVVRDLSNPDAKIYVDSGRKSSTPVREIPNRRRSRPKTPVFVGSEGGRKYSSDERRRHFERMGRDEPEVRPADWSDPRVRYNYYRDRGSFNDRPIRFEEFIEWEKWFYEYKEWLRTEEHYRQVAREREERERMAIPEANRNWYYEGSGYHGQPPPMVDARERLVHHPPGPPPHRGFYNNPRGGGNFYHHGNMEPPMAPPMSRQIGKTSNGSLVINIRPGNTLTFPAATPPSNYNYRGRGRGRGRGGF